MKRIVLILLVFSFSEMFSQVDYIKGYVLKGNEIVYCFIKKLPQRELQYQITVKSSLESSEEINYTPLDIREFYIENFGHFSSKKLSIRYVNDIMKSNNYYAKETEEFKEENVFLNTLVSGKANLYLFMDKSAMNHYFIEKDTIYELYVKKSFKMVPDKADSRDMNRMLVTQKNYLGKLEFLFSDCPDIKGKIKSVKLSEDALTKITTAYNNCNGEDINEEKKVQKILFEKSAGIGLSLNNYFIYSDKTNDIFENTIQPYNLTITGGLLFNFIMPRLSYDFSLYTGIQYLNNKFIVHYDTVNSITTTTYDVDLNTHFLQIPIFLKYTVNRFKIKPYVFAGLFSNAILKSSNNVITHTVGTFIDRTDISYFYDFLSAQDYKYHPAVKRVEFGYGIGLGVKIKIFNKSSLFIESRYENGNGISDMIGFGNTSKYISFISGVEF